MNTYSCVSKLNNFVPTHEKKQLPEIWCENEAQDAGSKTRKTLELLEVEDPMKAWMFKQANVWKVGPEHKSVEHDDLLSPETTWDKTTGSGS